MKTNLKTWMISNFILLLTIAAIGQPTTPFLTLNTEMHTAGISRIDSDKDGKTFLTVSHDKTAKLWNAQTGELIRTFRVPIGAANQGRLFAGAISPNGKIVAVGGWSYFDKRTHDIYFFDAHSNTLLHRISGLPNVILDIEFSPNGKYMVAALSRKNGIRVYEIPLNPSGFENLQGLKVAASFTDYSDQCSNAAFDPTGRLATASYDGKIRLYSNSFQQVKTIEATAGKQPYSLAFSPDGSLLAVGYLNSPKIEVRDGKTLNVLYEPKVTDVENANKTINKVSFSACGNYLIAGGYYKKYLNNSWWRQIRVYTNKGRGSYSDYPAASNSISDIKPLKNGDFIFAGRQPDFGRFTIKGTKVFYKDAEINNYLSSNKSHFKINSDGTAIGITPYGKKPLLFSVADRRLSLADFSKIPGLESYSGNRAGIYITDWHNTYNPKINSKATNFLKNYEINWSVDISKDSKKIVFGTGWSVYCTDESGNKLWEAPVQDMAGAVNISANNKTVAAAIANGTIQWYSMENEFEIKITGIAKNSIADKYGLKVSDIILKVNNIDIKNLKTFRENIKEQKQYSFEILRGGEKKIIEVNKTRNSFGFAYSYL